MAAASAFVDGLGTGTAGAERARAAAQSLFNEGKGGREELCAAIRIWQAAASAGDDASAYSYAAAVSAGFGCSGSRPDRPEAARVFGELARRGHPWAQYSLAHVLYAVGQQGPGLDEASEVAAQLSSSSHSSPSPSPPPSPTKADDPSFFLREALELFKLASDNGVPPAAFNAANMYARGEGTSGGGSGEGEVDDDAANLWYERAVSAGDPQAMLVLGTRLCVGKAGDDAGADKGEERGGEGETQRGRNDRGEGAPAKVDSDSEGVLDLQNSPASPRASEEQERVVRRRWLRGFPLHLQAAELGLPKAQYNVACHYFTGRFPRRDGVERGVGVGAEAEGKKGERDGDGDGDGDAGHNDPDYASAADWFEKAADAGLPAAMINLGNMHAQGLLLAESASEDAKERGRERARELYTRVLSIPEGRAEGEKKHASAALAAISLQ